METQKERQDRLASEKLHQRKEADRFNALVAKVKANCVKDKKRAGIQAVKYQLEYIKQQEQAYPGLSLQRTIEAYKKGINQYEESQK